MPQPEHPKPESLPFRFSLRSLVIMMLCTAMGGTIGATIAREKYGKYPRNSAEAVEALSDRWKDLQEATANFDPEWRSTFDRFREAAKDAGSAQALMDVLGTPDVEDPNGAADNRTWTFGHSTGNDSVRLHIQGGENGWFYEYRYSFSNGSGGSGSGGLSLAFGGRTMEGSVLMGALFGIFIGAYWAFIALVARHKRRLKAAKDALQDSRA